MHSAPRSRVEHHDEQAERTPATLGSLGADQEKATREAAVALMHAVLAIAATLASKDDSGQ